MNWTEVFLAIFFVVLGMFLLFLEFVIPSFGLLTIAAVVAFAAGVYEIWTGAGELWGVGVILVSLPLTVLVVKWLLNSRLGQAMNLKEKISGGSSDIPTTMAHLVGQEGVAVSALRPSGMALIDGQRHDVVTDGDFVDKGDRIVVVRIGTNSIVVDRVEETGETETEKTDA